MSSAHDILARAIDDDDDVTKMNVDHEDLEEATTIAKITEKIMVFDKAPATSTDEVPEPSIPQSKWDKLVTNVAELKANQVKINKKLYLVLELDKK